MVNKPFICLLLIWFALSGFGNQVCAQKDAEEMGMSMKEFIKKNHIDKIEDVIHKLAYSKSFLDQFLEEEQMHQVDIGEIRRKDVSVGGDIDLEVRHFTEHQTFTLVLVPISVYSHAIYDTLLFSVLEVTDSWLSHEFPYDDISNDSIKSELLARKNHDLLAEHLYDRALAGSNDNVGQFKVHLHESFISTNSIQEHMSEMNRDEKELIRLRWGVLKKALSHHVDLHVELNIYVFGFNDLEVMCKSNEGETIYKITPGNIFLRHHFVEN